VRTLEPGQSSLVETIHVSKAVLRVVPYFETALSDTWQDESLQSASLQLPDGCDVSVLIRLLSRIGSKEPQWGAPSISTVMSLIQLSSMLMVDDLLKKELQELLGAAVATDRDREEVEKWRTTFEAPDFLKHFLAGDSLAVVMSPTQMKESVAQAIDTGSDNNLEFLRKALPLRSQSGKQGLQETGEIVIEALGQIMVGKVQFDCEHCGITGSITHYADKINRSGRQVKHEGCGQWVTLFDNKPGARRFVSDIALPFLTKHREFVIPALRALQVAFPAVYMERDKTVRTHHGGGRSHFVFALFNGIGHAGPMVQKVIFEVIPKYILVTHAAELLAVARAATKPLLFARLATLIPMLPGPVQDDLIQQVGAESGG
ncbi:unnamed protein product, partial [Prorocentrum cordatum]